MFLHSIQVHEWQYLLEDFKNSKSFLHEIRLMIDVNLDLSNLLFVVVDLSYVDRYKLSDPSLHNNWSSKRLINCSAEHQSKDSHKQDQMNLMIKVFQIKIYILIWMIIWISKTSPNPILVITDDIVLSSLMFIQDSIYLCVCEWVSEWVNFFLLLLHQINLPHNYPQRW